MKHGITLYGHKGKVCLELIETFVVDTPSFCDYTYMVLCGQLSTQDDADQLECVIGYATSLYLVMINDRREGIPISGSLRRDSQLVVLRRWQLYLCSKIIIHL